MKARTLLIVVTSLVLIGAIFVGVVNALDTTAATVGKASLENVRAYAPTADENGQSFAVDGGHLFVGNPGNWTAVKTPNNVIVNAVTVDPQRGHVVYIGAANELAIYRSDDAGQQWQRIPLTSEFVGGVTDIAVDGAQRLLYVGTDTAGLFRLRDVGSSIIVSGHLLIDEPIIEVAAAGAGSGLVLARTEWHLYRAENFGMKWVQVTDLGSVPTAVAIANTQPATAYVGTTDRGLLRSTDGLTWDAANMGLGMAPGTRLHIDALAVDPIQPDVLYVASSYLFGSTTVHSTPAGVAMSTNGAATWALLGEATDVAVAELLPVSGETGSAMAVMSNSRTPVTLGNAEAIALANAETVDVVNERTQPGVGSSLAAWIVAGLAAMALTFAVATDLAKRRRSRPTMLAPSVVKQAR